MNNFVEVILIKSSNLLSSKIELLQFTDRLIPATLIPKTFSKSLNLRVHSKEKTKNCGNENTDNIT